MMMINDADALTMCLRGTPLEGRELTTYRLNDSGELLFSVEVGERELVPVWSAARDLVPRTGRWPFAGNSIPRTPLIELDAVDPTIRAGDRDDPVAGLKLAELIADQLRIARRQAWRPWGTLPQLVEHHLRFTRDRCGIAPDAAELLDQLPQDAEEEQLELFLLEWEEQHAPEAPAPNPWYLDWFFDGPTAPLLFAPTSSGPCSVVYSISYFVEGTPGLPPQRLVAMLDAWRQAYGAEIVANWGTMLQFLVARPPTTLNAAWPLAIQHELIAPQTLSGQTLRDHARNLINRPSWFLHSRP